MPVRPLAGAVTWGGKDEKDLGDFSSGGRGPPHLSEIFIGKLLVAPMFGRCLVTDRAACGRHHSACTARPIFTAKERFERAGPEARPAIASSRSLLAVGIQNLPQLLAFQDLFLQEYFGGFR